MSRSATTERIDAFRGIPQSYAMTEFETCDAERGLGGFRIEGIMGTPGIVASIASDPNALYALIRTASTFSGAAVHQYDSPPHGAT